MKSFKELNEMKDIAKQGDKPPTPPPPSKPKEDKKELFNDSKKKIQVRK